MRTTQAAAATAMLSLALLAAPSFAREAGAGGRGAGAGVRAGVCAYRRDAGARGGGVGRCRRHDDLSTDLPGTIDAFVAVKNRHVKLPPPAWTAIGISALYEPKSLVEINVTARVTTK